MVKALVLAWVFTHMTPNKIAIIGIILFLIIRPLVKLWNRMFG